MWNDIARGERIRLRTHEGEIIEGIVVAFDSDMLHVCRQKEWVIAKEEKRSPNSIGFKRSEIILEEPLETPSANTLER
jgi:hypothetical protein